MKLIIILALALSTCTPAAAGSAWEKVSSLRRGVRVRAVSSASLTLAAEAQPTVAPFDSPYNVNPKRCATGYMYVTCARDVQLDQRRYYAEAVAKEDREPMTVELCWNFCKNVSGAQFFGLENGDRCYCTPHFHDSHDYADGTCDMPCVGNPTQMCGSQRLQDIYGMHDCTNLPPVPCKHPPPAVQHARVYDSKAYVGAKVPCSNGVRKPLDTVRDALCSVECLEGYTLTQNDLKCTEHGDRLVYSWAQFSGGAVCTPTRCGVPKPLAHATFPQAEVNFGENVSYGCQLGYAVGGSPQGLKQQSSTCLASGKMSELQACEPIKCGDSCPSGPKYPNATFREQGVRVYQDSCTYDCAKGYTLNERPDGRDMFVLNCMYTGEFEEPATCLPVLCGAVPTVAFAAPVETLAAGHQARFPEATRFKCVTGYSLTGIAGGESLFEVSCRATGLFSQAPECKPVLNGNPPFVNNSIYQDRPYFYGESVTYTCKEGYTSDGKAGGRTVVLLLAGADGNWAAPPPKCLPVECGSAPTFPKATLRVNPPTTLNFDSKALDYACVPGYSTSASDDVWMPTSNVFVASCQANGEFSTPKPCVNINDCLIRTCGVNGVCEDVAQPTGEPLDDYTCKCDSGYEITLHESLIKVGALMKRCTNINDCPAPVIDACGGRNAQGVARGLCTDGLSAYNCTCGSGYDAATLASAPANGTCVPVKCGTVGQPPQTTSAPAMFGKEADFDTEPWTFSCVEGYSLDGKAGGSQNYLMRCTSTGTLSATQECRRVSCGAPKTIANSDMAPKFAELLFQDQVEYTCDEGYALNGDPKGIRVFKVDCLASGGLSYPDSESGVAATTTLAPEPGVQPPKGVTTTTTTPLACLPVICGAAPEDPHGAWNATKSYVYPEAVKYDCATGYSADGSAGDATASYKINCQSTGEFSAAASQCQRILCLDVPAIAHSNYTPAGPFRYGDAVTYTLEPGFSVVDPSVGEVNGSFTCHCGANAKFNGTCDTGVQGSPIDCGTAPEVAHGTVSGDTHFGGVLTAVAEVGFSLDGLANGATSFTFSCQADGRFSPRPEFLCITCGLLPDYQNIVSNDIIPNAAVALLGLGRPRLLKVRAAGAANGSHAAVQSQRRARRGGKRIEALTYGDLVIYTCDEGFRAAPASSLGPYPVLQVTLAHPVTFCIKCEAHGDFIMKDTGLTADTQCVPVTCDVAVPPESVPEVPLLPYGPARLQYKEAQSFVCREGFSLDGTPTGGTEFQETCGSTGVLSATHTCKDIDWCIGGRCGDHGTCSDGHLAYSCACESGYEVTYIDARYETCTQILECSTEGGDTACSTGGGVCVDGVSKYACQCKPGYENVPTSEGHDSCFPVVCPSAPAKPNATSPKEGQKLPYPATAAYSCQTGYTTNGQADGAISFTISCKTDGTLDGLEAGCLPIKCPTAPAVAKATLMGGADMAYGQTTTYKCDAGHSTNGYASGSTAFGTTCLATGALTAPESCFPVTCGQPPAVISASAEARAELKYQEVLQYTCAAGYSLDATAAGARTFDVACTERGTFAGLAMCQAIRCGLAPGIPSGQSPPQEYAYPAGFGAVCNTGYTVDASAHGESTFVVKCGPGGAYENVQECKPVSCGTAVATATSDAEAGAKVYGQAATWTCKKGYSTNGRATGGTAFAKLCGADGAFGTSSPADCVDVDYCADGPCGPNGLCTDGGAGVTAPGYSCSCFEGFEAKTGPGGSVTCSADDCAGSPCGEGGSCMDLSKMGGPQGSYSCNCAVGYALASTEAGGYTCARLVCGMLPAVDHAAGSEPYSVATWKGGPAAVDAFYGKPILKSNDVATYTCASGYSTDATPALMSRTFSVTCQPVGTGQFSRVVDPHTACLPIVCDKPFLPAFSKAYVSNDDQVFKFGDTAVYKCLAGYTLTGAVGAPASVGIQCEADGTFEDKVYSCLPVPCAVPPKLNATASMRALTYSGTTVYACDAGYYVGGVVAEAGKQFTGTCQADGSLLFSDAGAGVRGCEPCVCPPLPPQPNATVAAAAGVGSSLAFGQSASIACNAGYSLGGAPGADTRYQVSCTSAGVLSGKLFLGGAEVAGGPPGGTAACQEERIRVQGVVTDAEDRRLKLAGTRVNFLNGRSAPATAFTNSEGEYSVEVPAGDWTILASKAGYMDREKGPLSLTSSVRPGQGADMALSKPLPADAWRFVLTWGQDPKDLDSHTYFGCDLQTHVSWDGVIGTSEQAGGLSVTLDRDSTTGFGPETTTVRNAGKCERTGCCLVKFAVNHREGGSTLGASSATVIVYKGAKQEAKFSVPPCLGTQRWWTVFTIDVSTGVNILYAGERLLGPYLASNAASFTGGGGSSGGLVESWATSFDSARWSKVGTASGPLALITGINMKGIGALHRLDEVKYLQVKGNSSADSVCQEVDVTGTLVLGNWAACPVGFFLNGLYRTGSKYDSVDGIEQVTKAYCCRPKVAPAGELQWGTCAEQAWSPNNWSECSMLGSAPTSIVGLHAVLAPGAPAPAPAGPVETILHGSTSVGVFLGGKYIELGFRTNDNIGKMGTDNPVLAGLTPRSGWQPGIGMTADDMGFAADTAKALVIDYFLPGTPEESFWAGFELGGRKFNEQNFGSRVEDISPGGSTGAVRITATVSSTLQVVQTLTLGVLDRFFKNTITLKNLGSSAITNVRFMRSVDPDNTVDTSGDYITIQRVEKTFAVDGMAVVSARSKPYDTYYSRSGGKQAVLVYYSDDPRAVASYCLSGLAPGGVWDPQTYDAPRSRGETLTEDACITIAFKVNQLEPGAETTMNYYTALDSRPISEVIASVSAVSKPVLQFDKMQCCALRPAELLSGEPACTA